MSVGVVDLLEVVKIAKHSDSATVLASCAGQFAGQQLDNCSAIQQRRKRVVRGLVAHLLTRFQQVVFQLQNAQAGVQTRFQLFGIEGLDKVVVGARFQAYDNVLLRVL